MQVSYSSVKNKIGKLISLCGGKSSVAEFMRKPFTGICDLVQAWNQLGNSEDVYPVKHLYPYYSQTR